jgi:hypothetical protein
MDTSLPSPIAAYIEANARLDPDGMLATFAPGAVVHDEGVERVGHDAIRAWIQSHIVAYKAIFTPDGWRQEDGYTVVEGPAAGDFPGSPIRFVFRFEVKGGAIASLEVHDVPA